MKKTAQEYFEIGFDYATKGDWSKAAKALSKGLEIDPTNCGGILNRCTVYAMQNRLTEALMDADRLIELAPDDWHGYLHRGNILHEMGIHDLAMAAYKIANEKRQSQKVTPDKAHEPGVDEDDDGINTI